MGDKTCPNCEGTGRVGLGRPDESANVQYVLTEGPEQQIVALNRVIDKLVPRWSAAPSTSLRLQRRLPNGDLAPLTDDEYAYASETAHKQKASRRKKVSA